MNSFNISVTLQMNVYDCKIWKIKDPPVSSAMLHLILNNKTINFSCLFHNFFYPLMTWCFVGVLLNVFVM